jgi:hypothetical protein
MTNADASRSHAYARTSQLEVATDQAIAACGGNARDTVKALIVTNEFLEAEVKQLQAAVTAMPYEV